MAALNPTFDASAVPPRIVLPPQGELPPCVDFLKKFHGDAPWNLVAIKGEDIKAYTLEGEKRETRATEWVARWNKDGYAVYFHPNPLKRKNRKANKADVARAEWLWADLDPPKKATPEEIDAWRAERLAEFEAGKPDGLPSVTLLIDSGRGFWRFWKLREAAPTDSEIVGYDKGKPIIQDGPATRLVESYGRGMEQAFGGAADNCRNIDRIARLPGALTSQNRTERSSSASQSRATPIALEDFPQGACRKGAVRRQRPRPRPTETSQCTNLRKEKISKTCSTAGLWASFATAFLSQTAPTCFRPASALAIAPGFRLSKP